ncbi:MAG TPA: hypothetical protein VM935_01455 [Chitinophagaceae bacterium]|nr:hypothetical protein [Chitinophagaceae bacterium]
MAINKAAFLRKRYWKIMVSGLIVIALLILGLHIWFVNNARGVLQDIVHTKSKGKIRLELSHLRFEFLSNKLQVRQADLISTDSLNESTTYHIKFRKLTLRINSFWPLILQKKLLLDSIKLHDPEVTVTQWRNDTSSKISRDELSLSQEMGKLYNSMLDVLDDFGIRRIIINNAKVSLVNKIKPNREPIVVSNIYFDLIRTANDVKKRDEFVKDEQSVELVTTDQNIALPGGRHRLAFKNFHLELFSKRIQMDSCTVTAVATDSSKSSYTVFFKKLLLIGVDFDAMYRRNLIRADSVYCENPLFDIDINTTDAVKKKERPDPEKIIRELTGDLDLAFVGVKDAGIHINISGRKTRSLFNSNKDDFELRGLRINSDSSKPVVVRRFDMLVRDYRLFNEDSSSAYTFDSIHFLNNKIVLNNFVVSTSALGQNRNHNKKDFKIPFFELTGLDWYQLIFEENLKAREAALYNPVISYIKKTGFGSKKKVNIFTSLQNLDDLIALEKVDIINGQVNVQLGKAASFNLKNVNLSLYSNRVLESTNKEGLRRAVDHLSFSDGNIKIKDIIARLENVRYTGANLIMADKVFVSSISNHLKANLSSVVINNLLLDEDAETVILDGLKWTSASLDLKAFGKNKGNAKEGGTIHIRNISGNNTEVQFENGNASLYTSIPLLKVDALDKVGDEPAKLEGLHLKGNVLRARSGTMAIKADSYQVGSTVASYLTRFSVEKIEGKDSLQVRAPRINFAADINSLFSSHKRLISVEAISPDIQISKTKKGNQDEAKQTASSFRIDKLTAVEPLLSLRATRNDSVSFINFSNSPNSSISVSDLVMNGSGLQIGSFAANTNSATFKKPTGELFGVEKGVVKLQASKVRLFRESGQPGWSALINSLDIQNPNTFSLGKAKSSLVFDKVSVGNLSLASSYVTNINELIKYNVSAWLRTGTGQFIDSNTTLKWYNAAYNYKNKELSLDSFSYNPSRSRDSVIARSAFQTDYITFKSGALKLTDFNLQKYKQDSSLFADAVTVNEPVITIYRDKLPPFLAGRTKLLPTEIIQKLSLPVSIRKINLVDGSLYYTEKNAKTRVEGTLLLSHLDGTISGIKNRGIKAGDSLSLVLNAHLMDSALINLKVKESYLDTLSGFLMSLHMKPTTLSFLNPVIAPLSNVIITSGVIDSLDLTATGHDKYAFGEMRMYYHNLRIKLVKDGKGEHSGVLGHAATFLVNTFIIKKNNDGRKGLVYFERLRDRSFFNYIVKMTFSGMATSVGAKKNRKYLKAYRRQLENDTLSSPQR